MSETARGSFVVKVEPQGPDDRAEGSTLGRMTIDKEFHGDLEGTGKGQMLTAITDVEGSAAYVAIERLTCRLHGRMGSFVLQHTGTMGPEGPVLKLEIVPDSGSGQLRGIGGRMSIEIVDGNHSYALEYDIPPSAESPQDGRGASV